MATTLDERTRFHVDRAVADLAHEFRGVYSRETVQRFVSDSLGELASARVRDFVPVLAHRYARQRLHSLRASGARVETAAPEVLFVCVHNAGRSQMAAALARLRSEGQIAVRSAGSSPASELHAGVVAAMAELGVDLRDAAPEPLSDEHVRAADVVVTMGCGDACPVYPDKRYEDWDVADPAGLPVEEVRPIRDELDRRVAALLRALAPPGP